MRFAEGAKVFGLRDRDQATCGEVSDLKQEGIKVLEQRQIEDYLLADDVLGVLCQDNEHCTRKSRRIDRITRQCFTYQRCC